MGNSDARVVPWNTGCRCRFKEPMRKRVMPVASDLPRRQSCASRSAWR